MDKKAIEELNKLPDDPQIVDALKVGLKDREVRAQLAEALNHCGLKDDARIIVASLLQTDRSERGKRSEREAKEVRDVNIEALRLDDIHEADERWYTLAEYERTYSVPLSLLKAGAASHRLLVAYFHGGEPYVRDALVRVWLRPARPGTTASGEHYLPPEVEPIRERFLDYLVAAAAVGNVTDEERTRITSAVLHAFSLVLTQDEAEAVVKVFCPLLMTQTLSAPSQQPTAVGFAPAIKPVKRVGRGQHGGRSQGLTPKEKREEDDAIRKQARWLAKFNRPERLRIAQRAQRVGGGVPGGMFPEQYAVWCLENGFNPQTGEDVKDTYRRGRPPLVDYYPHLPNFYQPGLKGETEQQLKDSIHCLIRQAKLRWLEAAVDSLSDLKFWNLADNEDTDRITAAMRRSWLEDYAPKFSGPRIPQNPRRPNRAQAPRQDGRRRSRF